MNRRDAVAAVRETIWEVFSALPILGSMRFATTTMMMMMMMVNYHMVSRSV